MNWRILQWKRLKKPMSYRTKGISASATLFHKVRRGEFDLQGEEGRGRPPVVEKVRRTGQKKKNIRLKSLVEETTSTIVREPEEESHGTRATPKLCQQDYARRTSRGVLT